MLPSVSLWVGSLADSVPWAQGWKAGARETFLAERARHEHRRQEGKAGANTLFQLPRSADPHLPGRTSLLCSRRRQARSAHPSKEPLFFEGPWLQVTCLPWHPSSPSVSKSLRNILPLGWYMTVPPPHLCAEGRAPESYLESFSCEVSLFHKLPWPRRAGLHSSGVCDFDFFFFYWNSFWKWNLMGSQFVKQIEAEALWLKGASAYTGPGRPSSLRYSRSLLACRRMIQKPSSSRLRGECNLNRNWLLSLWMLRHHAVNLEPCGMSRLSWQAVRFNLETSPLPHWSALSS